MLTIQISAFDRKAIQRELVSLRRTPKAAKSSHISEALAHGLGFKTHAAICAALAQSRGPLCVELSSGRFWSRLSDLSQRPVRELVRGLEVDLYEIACRATRIRDMRGRIEPGSSLHGTLDRFFGLMADHGADYFTVEGSRRPAVLGLGGAYRPGTQAMRPCFIRSDGPRHSLSEWDDANLSPVQADDFLDDHMGSDWGPTSLVSEVFGLMEEDLQLGDIVCRADMGLLVKHAEIEGRSTSILFQRPGQLDRIRDADAARMATDPIPA
ncbi:hypothetical protein ACW9UR_23840 [Halovulum sp. GXIMD14794]